MSLPYPFKLEIQNTMPHHKVNGPWFCILASQLERINTYWRKLKCQSRMDNFIGTKHRTNTKRTTQQTKMMNNTDPQKMDESRCKG
jgi:hypothetical protein